MISSRLNLVVISAVATLTHSLCVSQLKAGHAAYLSWKKIGGMRFRRSGPCSNRPPRVALDLESRPFVTPTYIQSSPTVLSRDGAPLRGAREYTMRAEVRNGLREIFCPDQGQASVVQL